MRKLAKEGDKLCEMCRFALRVQSGTRTFRESTCTRSCRLILLLYVILFILEYVTQVI